MESNLEQRMKKYAKKNKRKKVWMKILSVLSATVVFCTTYALILPAITQEQETFCGKEEHTHSESCLAAEENVLICELLEEEAHFHSEECFETSLICEIEENHVHGEECYSEEELICEKMENHIHSEECSEILLVCELSEIEGHTHSEECYEIKTASCEISEHSHILSCYSDENADVETEEQWKAGFASAEFSEIVSENLITIAKTQLGYHESTKNYIVLEDGETIKGRTRYGEWYGEPYADWNLLFTGFCLEYAKAEIPFDADIEKWIELLSAPEIDIYKPCGEHETLPGDLIFFDEDKDGKPDRAGIIIEISENEYKTVIGDYGDSVQAVQFEKTDETIIGFGAIAIPSPYLCGLEEHIHENCFDENGNLICGFEEHIHNESCLEEKTEEILPEYFCGIDEHIHGEECYGEDGNLICEAEEHTHTEECLEEKPEKEYLCGIDEHIHGEECYGEDGNLICEAEEHAHSEKCLNEKPEEEYFCGFDEHSHEEACFDENENLVCEIAEHVHTEECKLSFENLPEEERIRIETVISMIEALPTADEIDAKIMEFEDAEDYEGEETWLTEIYQQVGMAYKYYMNLPENHRKFVTNSEKLMELEYIWSVATLIEIEVAKTADYSAGLFTESTNFVIYTTDENGTHYAFDGTGSAVPINITADGVITSGVANKNELLWKFSPAEEGYNIRNVSSGRYMHAFLTNETGVTTASAYPSFAEEVSDGVRFRSNQTDYARLSDDKSSFVPTQDSSEAAVYNFGIETGGEAVYVWLDGTWGGLEDFEGSDDTVYSIPINGKIILPTEWKTPDRYHYRVRGWYDLVAEKYYAPGAEATVTENTVFYPDWVPYTYDIGQYNAEASNTVSTSEFVTIKLFDFSPFYNIPYSSANVTVNASGHSETWTLDDTSKLIFRDWNPGKFSSPNNGTSGVNGYSENNANQGLWNSEVAELMFGTNNSFNPETGTGVMGKTYLGTGDFLFQYCDNPANTEYYGYYYFDSDYHAASYNRSGQRFYVYDYLSSAEGGGAAAFLPLNSPYVNTNGRPVATYSDNGEYGEYAGTTHYEYTGGNGVASEYWFGIQTDIEFYIANKPGETDSDGNSVNRGVNGEELVFNFSGDDDVWVFVDGNLVLDIGGIHQAVDGSINFSTGEVIVDGARQNSVTYLEPGEHVLTMYYLERGGGGSNCKVKFNISTRYGLKLLKEDVLTREMLNGAEFTVYTNEACTETADLWMSQEAYEAGEEPRGTFAVIEGEANFWGLAAGNTYYIKETKYPDNGGYGVANGIIVMSLNSQGQATFDVIPDPNGNGSDLSGGFTVHGFKIDVDNHEAYLVATNAKEEYGDEVTSVTVRKKWNDSLDHSKDSVTVYILANGYRIQEAILNENNDWTHTWKNLPINGDSGKPVTYTVEEGTVQGYFGTISELTSSTVEKVVWNEVSSVTSGETYLLKTSNGYLAASEGRFYWITDEAEAKASENARWIITGNNSSYTFTNEVGQTLYYYSYSSGWWNTIREFRAGSNPGSNTVLTFNNGRISYRSGNSTYYFSGISDSNGTTSTSSGSALRFTLYVEDVTTEDIVIEGKGFLITNEPITVDNSVSFKVNKVWDTRGFATEKVYEQFVVTMKLLENGKDSGMSAELMLKNGWTYTFEDLPKFDSGGNEIVYSVEEVWFSKDWEDSYSEITKNGNVFEVTVKNTYVMRYELPKTGGSGIQYNIIGGIFLITAGFALIYRINKRRRKEDTS